MRNKIIFYLNGKRKEEGADKASMMLADYLRYDQSLTGTKIVCAEGDCGSCSVLRYFPQVSDQYLPVNSCITLLAQLDGSSLVTVDALKKNDQFHESQKAMITCHGSQCGFCTPGFVIALTGLVEEKVAKKEITISSAEAKNCMTGNLCRCTGYQPIINAALAMDLKNCESVKERFSSVPQATELQKAMTESLTIVSDTFKFYAPKTMKEALDILKKNPGIRIMASATDLGVVHNKRKIKLNQILSLHLIDELYKIQESGGLITIGARVTIAEFRSFVKKSIPEFANYLDVFASPQIKNIGTIIGNVANASPIGDTPPAFLALKATVLIEGPQGKKEIPLSDFYLGYRKINLSLEEIITGLKFMIPEKSSTLRLFKNANRKDLDISAVNFAIKVDWKDEKNKIISDVTIAAGGVAATPLRFKKTEKFILTHGLTSQNLDQAIKEMHSEFNPLSDVRATAAYRHVIVENYFKRFFTEAGVLS